MIRTVIIGTPLGEMKAAATREGICFLSFNNENKNPESLEKLSKTLGLSVKKGSNKHLRMLGKQLKDYFKGTRKEFSLSLITHGTDFQKCVWDNLIHNTPYGTTKSYKDQAAELRNSKSARAVARANASNRIAIIIPCHRIIGSDGSLTGYAGGLDRKRWLINHEKKFSGKTVELDLF